MSSGGNVAARREYWLLALGILLNPITFLVISWNTLRPMVNTGPSMRPAVSTPGLSFTDRLTYHVRAPRRGEIVTFRAPWDGHTVLEKRIIGLPGEEVEVDEGVVYIDGTRLDESYAKLPYDRSRDYAYEVLGRDQYWVMGDNRGRSFDSRDFGPIQASSLEGRKIGTYFPLSHASVVGLLLALFFWGTVLGSAVGFGLRTLRLARERGIGRSVAFWGVLLWAFGFWVVWRRQPPTGVVTDGSTVPRLSRLAMGCHAVLQLAMLLSATSVLGQVFSFPSAETAGVVIVADFIASMVAFRRHQLVHLWVLIEGTCLLFLIFGGIARISTDNPLTVSVAGLFGIALGFFAALRLRRRKALQPATTEGSKPQEADPSRKKALASARTRGTILITMVPLQVSAGILFEIPMWAWVGLVAASLVPLFRFQTARKRQWRHWLHLLVIIGLLVAAIVAAHRLPAPLDLALTFLTGLAAVGIVRLPGAHSFHRGTRAGSPQLGR